VAPPVSPRPPVPRGAVGGASPAASARRASSRASPIYAPSSSTSAAIASAVSPPAGRDQVLHAPVADLAADHRQQGADVLHPLLGTGEDVPGADDEIGPLAGDERTQLRSE